MVDGEVVPKVVPSTAYDGTALRAVAAADDTVAAVTFLQSASDAADTPLREATRSISAVASPSRAAILSRVT